MISLVANAQWMSKAISITCAACALHGAPRTRRPRIPTFYCILFMLKLEKFILALAIKQIKRTRTHKKDIRMNIIKCFLVENVPLQVSRN